MSSPFGVAVIVAARNMASTLNRAVASALSQPETREVIVVDDQSNDDTAGAAQAADDGSGRLRVIVLQRNVGPAAARNLAIAASTAPYLALLDGDDFFLQGRFAALFAHDGWDVIADNIAFVRSDLVDGFRTAQIAAFAAEPQAWTLADFIAGNLSFPGRPRAEWGFVKPVIRRAVLDAADIRYRETMRLGEDYALYCDLLASGARFVRIRSCGYVAVERSDSLSARHSVADLANLLGYDRELIGNPGLGGEARRALSHHLEQIRSRHHYRDVLEVKRTRGWASALTTTLKAPGQWPALVSSLARDKFGKPAAVNREIRYLFA